VDGVLKRSGVPYRTSSTGLQHVGIGNYGYSTITSVVYVDNLRLHAAGGNVASVGYDNRNRTSEIFDGSAVSARFGYDGHNRLVEVRDGRGAPTTRYRYLFSRDTSS